MMKVKQYRTMAANMQEVRFRIEVTVIPVILSLVYSRQLTWQAHDSEVFVLDVPRKYDIADNAFDQLL